MTASRMGLGWRARAPSPVTRVRFRGQDVHVKRDDVFHLAGNKMRKLHWLLRQDAAFFQRAHLVSYGGTQSNAMLAIAQLAHAKDAPFTYFTRGLAGRQSAPPLEGTNLAAALDLGMRHVPLSVDDYHALAASRDLGPYAHEHVDGGEADSQQRRRRPVLIPQGAAFAEAEEGFAVLADELTNYCREALGEETPVAVVLPAGTGASAFYLARHVPPYMEVFAVPCVGDAAYLASQFATLEQLEPAPISTTTSAADPTGRRRRRPTILVPEAKARFGRLSWPLYDLHAELLGATGIEFDLLYGAFAWQTLFAPANLARVLHGDGDKLGPDDPRTQQQQQRQRRELLYVHTGGVTGNASMLARYREKLASRGPHEKS